MIFEHEDIRFLCCCTSFFENFRGGKHTFRGVAILRVDSLYNRVRYSIKYLGETSMDFRKSNSIRLLGTGGTLSTPISEKQSTEREEIVVENFDWFLGEGCWAGGRLARPIRMVRNRVPFRRFFWLNFQNSKSACLARARSQCRVRISRKSVGATACNRPPKNSMGFPLCERSDGRVSQPSPSCCVEECVQFYLPFSFE